MRRRVLTVERSDIGVVPDCLQAGACIEVWDPVGRDWLTAWQAFRNARQLWRDRAGFGQFDHAGVPRALRSGGRPWSFDVLTRTPARLAQQLHFRGLPPGWEPTEAPAEWRLLSGAFAAQQGRRS